MNEDTYFFDLNDEQVKKIEEKYALFEPLLNEYLSKDEKHEYKEHVYRVLGISERTLRRYLQRLREDGIYTLTRKKRSDAGKLRTFSEDLLKKALELLDENRYRSVPMLMNLLEADENLAPLVKKISPHTLYYHLKKSGYDFKHRGKDGSNNIYKRFQADYPNHLWQGDARDGICLPDPNNPEKTKMTYLFGWMDDFSRKFMYARYYWDEKLPRMEDCFRQAVLRWGLPENLYCDNGAVFISNYFLFLVSDLEIKKIHHRAYSAWCKGKIENGMKTIKRFQREAGLAGFRTIEELNNTLHAWIEVEYNSKIHSSTGETPNNRYRENINAHPPRRIKDIDHFNSLFFYREPRTVNKYSKIQFNNNLYPVYGLPVGEKVEIRFNPFDLEEILVFRNKTFFSKIKATALNTKAIIKDIPEEKKRPDISKASVEYFKLVREKYTEQKTQQADNMRFSDLKKEEN